MFPGAEQGDRPATSSTFGGFRSLLHGLVSIMKLSASKFSEHITWAREGWREEGEDPIGPVGLITPRQERGEGENRGSRPSRPLKSGRDEMG